MYFQERNIVHSSPTQYLALLNFFRSRLVRFVCAETSLVNAEKYWPSMKFREIYSLHQVSTLSTIPAPTKHREKFWSL